MEPWKAGRAGPSCGSHVAAILDYQLGLCLSCATYYSCARMPVILHVGPRPLGLACALQTGAAFQAMNAVRGHHVARFPMFHAGTAGPRCEKPPAGSTTAACHGYSSGTVAAGTGIVTLQGGERLCSAASQHQAARSREKGDEWGPGAEESMAALGTPFHSGRAVAAVVMHMDMRCCCCTGEGPSGQAQPQLPCALSSSCSSSSYICSTCGGAMRCERGGSEYQGIRGSRDGDSGEEYQGTRGSRDDGSGGEPHKSHRGAAPEAGRAVQHFHKEDLVMASVELVSAGRVYEKAAMKVDVDGWQQLGALLSSRRTRVSAAVAAAVGAAAVFVYVLAARVELEPRGKVDGAR